MIVVTAADRPYWRCLYQFLLSAERRHVPRDHRVVAYDLGLGADKLAVLARRFPWCDFRAFDFTAWPAHVAMAAASYAWKPVIIDALIEETGEAVLWLDSATVLKGQLTSVEKQIREQGVLALRGQASIAERVHPDTLMAMSAPREILDRRERVSGAIGFDPAFPAVRRIVRDWRDWSMRPEVIQPATPFPRHMWEQAILSVLLLKAEFAGEITLAAQDIDISSPTPVRWMSSRNKVKPDFPIWLDPLTRLRYAAWKFADRRALGFERWKRTRLWGLERWLREDYTVHLRHLPSGRSSALRGAGWSYYADPFLWRQDGKLVLFAEQFLYAFNRARIVCLEIGQDLTAGPPTPILDLESHASFPFPFEYRGRLYMVPETCDRLCIDLFVCDRFPDRWRRERRLLHGIDAADSVLFPWRDRWWLITSARDHKSERRHLRIYFTDDPLTGEWQPHPINQQRLYADQPWGSYRNAGAPRIEGGELFRPVQVSRRHYGEGAAMMRIDLLTREEFAESFVEESELTGLKTHHISHAGDVMAWDERIRAF